MEARLVALIIEGLKAGESAHFGATAEYLVLRHGENAVETLGEALAAYFGYELTGLMRHIEGILPGIAFLEAAPHLHGIEIIDKLTAGQSRTHESGIGIVYAFPAAGKPVELRAILIFTETACELRSGP